MPTAQHDEDHLHRVFELPSSERHESKPSAATPEKKPAHRTDHEFDDKDVEQAMFNQFAKRNGEVDLTTRVEVHEHGTNASPAAVVEVLLAKIIAWQFRVYGRRVLGIPFTIWLITTWATKWIQYHLDHPPRPKPRQQHSRYNREQAAVGGPRGRATQGRTADRGAAQAQVMRLNGSTAAQIAKALKVCKRTVRYWFKRFISPELLRRFLPGVQSANDRTGTLQSADPVPVKTTAIPPQPAETAPQEPIPWRCPNTRASVHGLNPWLLL